VTQQVRAVDYLLVFSSRRIAAVLLLGFASGLPLALTAGTLQAWLAVENVDIKTIGLFTLVGQPYTYKFLWAPLMDRFTLPFLGRRRGWLIVTQASLLAVIAFMGTLDPREAPWLLAATALGVAFLSASQDIVFDAYRTDVLREVERGPGAAISVLGYRIAMLVSGGGALVLADQFLGWHVMYFLMAALMGIGIVAAWFAPEPEERVHAPDSLAKAISEPLKEFFSRRGAWLLLLLIGDSFQSPISGRSRARPADAALLPAKTFEIGDRAQVHVRRVEPLVRAGCPTPACGRAGPAAGCASSRSWGR
jgi:MFS transporter, PAT family, beta-lactamase induction signal transducer AmpG